MVVVVVLPSVAVAARSINSFRFKKNIRFGLSGQRVKDIVYATDAEIAATGFNAAKITK